MKKLLLTSLFTLAISSVFAQITVKPIDTDATPGVSTDDSPAFIYVNDVVLYVESDINLTKNPTNAINNIDGEFEGSIYLRGDAQLFQGAAASTNSGDGLLSVYQTSYSDAYDYNYWMSPVSFPDPSIAGNQNSGLTRMYDVKSITRSTVIGVTSDVTGFSSTATGGFAASSGNMRISTRWTHIFDPAIYNFVQLYSNNAAPGQGFTMKGTNITPETNSTDINLVYNDLNSQRYDFRGRPNSGDINVDLIDDTAFTDSQFVLTGNPYPSILDLAAFFNDPGNIGKIDHIAFWDEDRSINSHFYADNKGGYGSWVPFGTDPMNPGDVTQGLYVPAVFLNYDSGGNPLSTYQVDLDNDMVLDDVEGENINRRYAPIAQGFMIAADPDYNDDTTVDATTVTFKNSHRATLIGRSDAAAGVFRTTQQTTDSSVSSDSSSFSTLDDVIDTRTPHMMINTYFPGSHNRFFAFGFSPDTTVGFDHGFDSTHPMDATADIYMPIMDNSQEKLLTQGLPFSIDMAIPITIVNDIPGSVLLNVAYAVNMPVDKAYLYDAGLSTYQEITDDQIANINLPEAGEIKNRFYIVFQSEDEGNENFEVQSGFTAAKQSVEVFQDNRLAIMEVLNPDELDLKNAEVYDMGGKLIHTESNIGNTYRYNFSTATFADGVYIVKLTTKDNLVLDYKVTIFNKG